MKHIILIMVLAALVALNAASATAAEPDGADITADQEPLMVIRFNQPNVYYQLPLYNAIKKTLAIYPNASFQLVAAIPTTGDYKTDEKSTKTTHEHTGQILTTLQEIGLPEARFRTLYRSDSTITDSELRIFVR